MSFSGREQSLASGKPVRLYRFKRGVLVWLYTSCSRDIAIGTQIYWAVKGGIDDDGVRRTGEATSDRLKLTAPGDLEVAGFYRGVPPSSEIDLTIYDHHVGEATPQIVWSGTIETVSWPALDRCVISAQTLLATLDVPGLRLTWERNCGTSLYSRRCGVNRDLYRVDMELQSLNGAAVTCAAAEGYEDGWFSGGYVEWPIGGGEFERRAIEQHSGSTLNIMGGTAGLVAGQQLRVYPGCARIAQVCHDKYDNLDNMRADPNLMGKNPFDGNPVF